MGNPITYLEVKRSKPKVTRPINVVTDNVEHAARRGNSQDTKVKVKSYSIK